MATYTLNPVSTRTYSITSSSSSNTEIPPGGVTPNSPNDVYYAMVNFTYSGSAVLRFGAYSTTYGTVPIYAQAARPTASFDYDTGTVSPSVATGDAYPTSSQIDDALTIDVTAGETYYFYFRRGVMSGVAVIFPYIYFEPYSGPTWSHVVEDIGYVDTTLSRTISSAQQSSYTLYCFRIRSHLTTDGNIVIESTGSAPTQMYLTTSESDSAYNHKTGNINSSYLFTSGTASASGPEERISVNIGNSTAYFWIRHDNGTNVGDLSFTIYPPGATWSTRQVGSSMVGASGKTWSNLSAGFIAQKTVDYYSLSFTVNGSFQFSSEGPDVMWAYLTTSPEIDSNGRPSSDVIVGSDTGSGPGFSFVATVNTRDSYYLMFRTQNGDANTRSFTIIAEANVTEWSYTSQTAQTSIAGSRDVNVTLSKSTTFQSKYFRTTYAGSGTVQVSIDGNGMSQSNLVVYMVPGGTYSYDPTDGAPYLDSNHVRKAGGASVISFDVVSGQDYYIWARGTPPDVSGTVVVSIRWAEKQWTYPQQSEMAMLERETTSSPFTLSEKTGAMFKCSFRYAGSASMVVQGQLNAILYVTEGNYGFSTSGVPWANASRTTPASGASSQTIAQALMSTDYYVWVSPGSLTTTGDVTVTITPPPPPSGWELDDRTSDSSMTDLSENISSKSISLSARHTAEYVLSIVQDGTVRITSSGNIAVSIYVGVADSTISTSNGIPADYDYYDEGSNNFDVSFRGESGTTYYIWIKCNSAESSGTITIAVSVPSILVGDRGFWVFTSDLEWRKLTPYIVVQSGSSYAWTEAKGYVYTANGWGDQY